MGYEYTFYVESHTSGIWTTPPDFKDAEGYRKVLGDLFWISVRRPEADLFFGDMRLFEMRPGVPPDCKGSALFRRLEEYNHPIDDRYFHWLSVEELILDFWNESTVLVKDEIQSRYADLFGAGQERFPEAELLEAGLDKRSTDWLRHGFRRLTTEPIDQSIGKNRWKRSQLPDDALVAVTWQETISSFLGEWLTKEFMNLRNYGPDESLRIITEWS